MRAIHNPALWSLFVMALLVAGATVMVVEPGLLAPVHTAQAVNCPEVAGGGGQVYCENVSVPPASSGQLCSVGANASGNFHAVIFTFQRYISCGPLIYYGINGSISESNGSPQQFDFSVGPPGLILWCNYTSPDGLVLVSWLGLNQNVTLAVKT